MIRNRQEYAKAARKGLTAVETVPQGPSYAEIRAWTAEIIAVLDHTHQATKENLNVAAKG